jgi:hypothetical protein
MTATIDTAADASLTARTRLFPQTEAARSSTKCLQSLTQSS